MSSDEAQNIVETSSTDFPVGEMNIVEQSSSGQVITDGQVSEDQQVLPEDAAEQDLVSKDSPKDPIAEEDTSAAAEFVPSGEEPFLTVCHVQSLSQELFDLDHGLGNNLDDLELADRKDEQEIGNSSIVFTRYRDVSELKPFCVPHKRPFKDRLLIQK